MVGLPQLTYLFSQSVVMDPNPDFESKDQPDELPPSAKLQAGYVRYVRIKPEERPDGQICLETCIRRSRSRGFYYIAVSYAWGDATPRHPVIVDGHERLIATNLWHFVQRANMQRTTLQVTKEHRNLIIEQLASRRLQSLESLRELRRKLKELDCSYWPEDWLWVDALCIDQSNADERTHQVGIMSEIFGRADQVISWLGPAYDNSEHAMSAIATYSDKVSVEHQNISPADLSDAICSLCERPYWKRLWVFQELRHAKDISLLCGEHSLSWDDFRNVWRVIVDIATTSEDASERLRQSLATRMMTLRTKPMDFSLWNLLKETRNLECADRRDRVYALLSVATEGHEGIEADYGAYTNWLDLLKGTESIPDTVRRKRTQHFVERGDWRDFLATSALAHRVLSARYATRPPATLEDVRLDCEFLVGVFDFEAWNGVYGDRLRPPQGDDGFYDWARANGHQAVVNLLDMLD